MGRGKDLSRAQGTLAILEQEVTALRFDLKELAGAHH
jgi:hypothetical protein